MLHKVLVAMNSVRKIVMVLVLVFASGCGRPEAAPRDELLVYCGITMIQPMREVADIIEAERGCVIKITKGGSGNLLRAIRFNRAGDLFLPGRESYMETCLQEGLVEETAFLGYNVAAIVVPKGNPKHIPNDPEFLTNSTCVVIMADPGSGSIGLEAKAVLERRGVFEAVMKKGTFLTTDSKDITRALKSGTADVGINWYATTLWDENVAFVDGMLMDEQYAPQERLVIGLLHYSRFPDTARRFMEYASSPEGRAIFRKYGFFPGSGPEDGKDGR